MKPRPIVQLTQPVIDKIAAGEVVQRPCSALKEMLENSLDANATRITVKCRDGGVSLLHISDNGHGIAPEDLPLLCARFATSKMKHFDDLQEISTFGFRGEALASISHVSRLTVTTMTTGAQHAVVASFKDGKMLDTPKSCAGQPGTTLVVEDMFHNAPLRRQQALSRAQDEYQRICDVVTKYAIANPTVAFSCQRVLPSGATRMDVSFPGTHDDSKEIIRTRYGVKLANSLVPFAISHDAQDDPERRFKMEGYCSNLTHDSTKLPTNVPTLILFINKRLVENAALFRCMESAYAPFLLGGGQGSQKPFVFLSLTVHPHTIDVNMHPAKSEVLLLYQDHICSSFFQDIKRLLSSSIQDSSPMNLLKARQDQPQQTTKDLVNPSQLNRTDEDRGALLKFARKGLNMNDTCEPSRKRSRSPSEDLPTKTHRTETPEKPINISSVLQSFKTTFSDADDSDASSDDDNIPSAFKNRVPPQTSSPEPEVEVISVASSSPKKVQPAASRLSSVQALIDRCRLEAHEDLTGSLKKAVLVGVMPRDASQCLLQCGTALTLTDICALAYHVAYQRILLNWGTLPRFHLEPPQKISQLVGHAWDHGGISFGSTPEESIQNRQTLIKGVGDVLGRWREMLEDYFGFVLEPDHTGAELELKSIPAPLGSRWIPEQSALPLLVVRLATEVNFESELLCFEAISKELALIASVVDTTKPTLAEQRVRDGLLPSMRSQDAFVGLPLSLLQRGNVKTIVTVPQLYKVFERC